jgi:glycyl-tRNA synthetase
MKYSLFHRSGPVLGGITLLCRNLCCCVDMSSFGSRLATSRVSLGKYPLEIFQTKRFGRCMQKCAIRKVPELAVPTCELSKNRRLIFSRAAISDERDLSTGVTNVSTLTFQDVISRLQEYWASVGCALWLPHNTEVGAGTMNPATFLRVLGPEPWNVAYAEPSIRPDDSRYGDNPNRVQRHTQFQVILKPDPGNPQELYLKSLQAIGIDTNAHDIRFVEDNWESPVLGAWGLGWEVWLDGMEVTQFTYFQQAGGKPLPVPAVEITYGLERIIMSLQGVEHFKDITYAPGVTYGEMFLQNEYEMSVYNLDEADVDGQRERFNLYEKEARKLLDQRLPVPAYDHLLKLSHTFNIMDARGAVGVTERAECFATLRSLAREVTALWVARREEQAFPLGICTAPEEASVASESHSPLTHPATFVLEIGCEEMPPEDLDSALEQLRSSIPEMLDRCKLGHAGVVIEGTPRRLVILVHELVAGQSSSTDDIRGPPAKVAYDAEGVPTPALMGFCKKNNVTIQDCRVEEDDKGTGYVWVTVNKKGRPTSEVLAGELPPILRQISFKKSMKWRGDQQFSRPIRWLLSMHGESVIPIRFAGLQGGSSTRLLRNSATPVVEVTSADAYGSIVSEENIIISVESRRQRIWDEINTSAENVGGVVPHGCKGSLLSEVANLVESPSIVVGSFDEKFLELPKEILVMVMRKHQRYFPVYRPGSDDLLPHFVTVANGAINGDLVKHGNEAVIRARFEDAQFFYQADRRSTLKDVRPKLKGTTFQKELGSLLDKTDRIERIVSPLSKLCGSNEKAEKVALKAAHLCKADLATSTVTEMTALAGVMGKHYALQEGQDPDVAQAIFESVLPRQAGDQLPETIAGTMVSLADKLDSLVGLFACNCGPTSNADPYGLRRAAVGLLMVLINSKVHFDLRVAIDIAAGVQPVSVSDQCKGDIREFILKRLEQILVDEGVQVEAVRASVSERGDNPALASKTAKEIAMELEIGEASSLHQVMSSMARSIRLTRGKDVAAEWKVDPCLFESDVEKELYDSYLSVASEISSDCSIAEFVNSSERLIIPLESYFESVFVMSEDAKVRQSRLALMRDIAALSKGIMNLTELPGF